jgi:hypothetical protein
MRNKNGDGHGHGHGTDMDKWDICMEISKREEKTSLWF